MVVREGNRIKFDYIRDYAHSVWLMTWFSFLRILIFLNNNIDYYCKGI